MSRYLYKKIQNISPESLNFQHSGLKLTTLGSDCASSKGYIVRWVEAPSNKLLTTAFEASLESVTVTCRLSVDSKITGIAIEHRNPKVTRGSTSWSGWKTTYVFIVMVRFYIPLRCWLELFMLYREYISTGENLHFLL